MKFWFFEAQENLLDENGMYNDVNVFDIGETASIKKKTDQTTDVKFFFSEPFILDGQKKKWRHCNICRWDLNWMSA